MINTSKIFNRTILNLIITLGVTLAFFFLVPKDYTGFVYTFVSLLIVMVINICLSLMKKVKPYVMLSLNDSIFLGLFYSYILKIFIQDISDGYVLIVLGLLFVIWLYDNIFIEIKIFSNRRKELKLEKENKKAIEKDKEKEKINDEDYEVTDDLNIKKKNRKAYLLRYNLLTYSFIILFILFEFLTLNFGCMPFFNMPTVIAGPVFIICFALLKKVIKL